MLDDCCKLAFDFMVTEFELFPESAYAVKYVRQMVDEIRKELARRLDIRIFFHNVTVFSIIQTLFGSAKKLLEQ